MTRSLEVLVDIPALSFLADGTLTCATGSDQVALTVEKLAYRPDAADIWNLPAEQPAITGTLDLEGAFPRMRCTLPLPEAGEASLYRVAILKTGTTLDAEGKSRAEQLLPTEEELLFIVLGASDRHPSSAAAHQRQVPGIQYVIVPTATS